MIGGPFRCPSARPLVLVRIPMARVEEDEVLACGAEESFEMFEELCP
jgi:hypothetical protein